MCAFSLDIYVNMYIFQFTRMLIFGEKRITTGTLSHTLTHTCEHTHTHACALLTPLKHSMNSRVNKIAGTLKYPHLY